MMIVNLLLWALLAAWSVQAVLALLLAGYLGAKSVGDRRAQRHASGLQLNRSAT